jgi:hypothetical protein
MFPGPSQLYTSNRRNSGPHTIRITRWNAETKGSENWRHKPFSNLEDVTQQTKQERWELVAYISCITQRKPELYFLCIPVDKRPDCLPENPLNASSKLLRTIKKCLLQKENHDVVKLKRDVLEWLRKAAAVEGRGVIIPLVPARSEHYESSSSEAFRGPPVAATTMRHGRQTSKKQRRRPLASPPASRLGDDGCQPQTPTSTFLPRNSLTSLKTLSSSSTSLSNTTSRSSSDTFSAQPGARQSTPLTPVSPTSTPCTRPLSVTAAAKSTNPPAEILAQTTSALLPTPAGEDSELARYLSRASSADRKPSTGRTSAVIRMEMDINEAEIEAKQAKHEAEQSKYEAKQLLIQKKRLQLELHLKE